MKGYKIIATGILELGLIFGGPGCAAQRPIDMAVSEGRIEKPVISSLSEAGIDSLIDSELDKEIQVSVNMLYCMLMLTDSKTRIKEEIDEFADYKFGRLLETYDKRTDRLERDIAYLALYSVLKTVADFNGNQNGKAEWDEIDRYYEKFGDKPIVQVLKEYFGEYKGD